MKSDISSANLPLVSVVIASYNHARFIEEALDTVAAQCYPNIELIVIDDCSKDDSAKRIIKWARKSGVKKRFQRIVVEIAKENAGAHNTLNKGAEIAQGKYLNFLNSDDFFAHSRITTLFEAVDSQNTRWGFTGVRVIDDEGKQIMPANLPPEVGFVYEGIGHAQNNYPTLSCGLLERNFVISTGNIFVESILFKRLGGFRNLRYLHDWDFILRATRLSEPTAVDEPLYAYRLHGTNSFKSLAEVAAVEGAFVLKDHLKGLHAFTENTLAPSPKNWPVLFDTWIDRLSLRHLAPHHLNNC